MMKKSLYSFSLLLLLSANISAVNYDDCATCEKVCPDCPQENVDPSNPDESNEITVEKAACANCITLKLTLDKKDDQTWASIAECAHNLMRAMPVHNNPADAIRSVKELYGMVRNNDVSGNLSISFDNEEEKEAEAPVISDETPELDLEAIVESEQIEFSFTVENRGCCPDAWRAIAMRTLETIEEAQEEQDEENKEEDKTEAIFEHCADLCPVVTETEGLHGSLRVIVKRPNEMNQA